MSKTRKLLAALAVAGLTAAPLGTTEAFWGFWPGSWFGGGGGFSFGFGVGSGWHGYGGRWWRPWYGPGWHRFHRWGYPGWGYPYWGGYSLYGLPYLSGYPVLAPVTTLAPVAPAQVKAEK